MKNRRIQNQFGKHRSKNTPPEFNIRFEKYLNQRGYKHHTIRAYVKSINHITFWLKTKPPDSRGINREAVQALLYQHLPVCCCALSVSKDIKTVRAALNQFMLMEGHERLRRSIDEASPEVESIIGFFDKYLQKVCGHSENTRWYHRRHVRMFLSWLIDERHEVHTHVTPQIIFNNVENIGGASEDGLFTAPKRLHVDFYDSFGTMCFNIIESILNHS